MKRSEAVNVLITLITQLKYIEGLTDKEFAEDVLKVCEDMGMQPPYVCNDEICCRYEWEDEV